MSIDSEDHSPCLNCPNKLKFPKCLKKCRKISWYQKANTLQRTCLGKSNDTFEHKIYFQRSIDAGE